MSVFTFREREMKRSILRDWLIVGACNSEICRPVEEANRLETQIRVDVAALIQDVPTGQTRSPRTPAEFPHCSLEGKLLLLWETPVFALQAFN